MGGRQIRGQLLKGMTPLLVLSVLEKRELYGYQIAVRIREQSGGAFALSESTLYPTLHSLEAAGALEANWRESHKGPPRRYYSITPHGRQMLVEHQSEWSAFSSGVAQAIGDTGRG